MADFDLELVTKHRKKLVDPAYSLHRFGKIINQRIGSETAYDPHAITHKLQATIISYASTPPRTEHGQVAWLALLGYRQGGKSTSAEAAFYPKAAYIPGHDHVCIADTRERAEYLHSRVHIVHDRWPREIRTPTIPYSETRKLTFAPYRDQLIGGSMRVLSGWNETAGIGQSPDSFHGSETPFWKNAGKAYNYLIPAMINRDNAYLISESTPAPADAPSVEYWKELCQDAKLGMGRWIYAFFPYWDGKLNSRPWPEGAALWGEEINLLNKYGHLGMKKEHLAFRRLMLETDKEIRRHPELFDVFYPRDDVTCWISSTKGVIPKHAITRHAEGDLLPWEGPYTEFEAPESGATYVIGVDPAGYAARDHAAFQILKVWDGEWTQVAAFADHTDPVAFTEALVKAHRRYNNAKMGVEITGVGTAVVALLQAKGLTSKMYYRKAYRPGISSNAKTNNQHLGWVIDALMDTLVLRDEDTVHQLTSYGNDKTVERSVKSETLNSGRSDRLRRERHHWDKVSALIFAVVTARSINQRSKPSPDGDTPPGMDNILLYKNMSWNQLQEHRKAEAKDQTPKRRRSRYRRGKPKKR
jgi:hypothetical protein